MKLSFDSTAGTLRISRGVIATIAKSAALEIVGVGAISEFSADIKGFFSKGQIPKPVSVILNDDIAEVTVNIVIKNGFRIGTVAESVQKAVKESVQSMTGITVSKVNVVITGISF